jgi:hypothetical protein
VLLVPLLHEREHQAADFTEGVLSSKWRTSVPQAVGMG